MTIIGPAIHKNSNSGKIHPAICIGDKTFFCVYDSYADPKEAGDRAAELTKQLIQSMIDSIQIGQTFKEVNQ